MNNRLEELLTKIKSLERELAEEAQKKGDEFFYEIKEKKVRFQDTVRREHKKLVKKIVFYLFDANILNIITAPVIWLCLVPIFLLDLIVSIYHAICFPVYRIPKVVRSDYVVIDRHSLAYLNLIEKINCVYCGYVNGVIDYSKEIAERTEQYWCPIKHARKAKGINSRYKHFFEYGDAEGYKSRLEEVRREFDDIEK
ncbi:MAG: hypothetical protein HY807_01315 [Nitrospirae bacterium]|nr:hypothetical protein [Nitrospirota bacterium]